MHKSPIQLLVITLILSTTLWSCEVPDHFGDESTRINQELAALLDSVGGANGRRAFLLPQPDQLDQIPQDPRNPLSAEKVVLGKHLYHETGLAVTPLNQEGLFTYSCASCHHVDAGFQAGVQQGIGEGGEGFGLAGEARKVSRLFDPSSIDVQPFRSPSALNVAFQTNMLWNGQFGATGVNAGTEAQWTPGTPKEINNLGFEGVETQAIAGLAVHRMGVNADLLQAGQYKEWFEQAFNEIDESQRFTLNNIGLAIAAYERTLMANEAPFQQWLRGDDDAMTLGEKRGALLFFGKGNCASCHKGPALNEMEFYALGMDDMEGNNTVKASSDLPANKGRGDFTKVIADEYKFKVPQLYNLKDSPFYGHGGTFTSVREVIEYKNMAVAENLNVPTRQLAAQFEPLNLSESEIILITTFIEDALYDNNLQRYVPASLPSDLCFPNNDLTSKTDLGCE